MNYLWKLVLKGGEEIDLPEVAALSVQAAIKRGEQFYHNPVRTFAIDQIKSLEKTSRVDTSELRGQIGNGPQLPVDGVPTVRLPNGEEAVTAMRVKKQITKGEWEKTYSKNPAYTRTDDDGYWVAYTRPEYLGVPDGHIRVDF